MAQRSLLSTGLSGVAGEYFVAAELSRRGYIATVTLRNARGVDILAVRDDGSGRAPVQIQVKTNQGHAKSWVLSKKAEDLQADTLFYAFVSLNGLDGAPEYHIVRSADVARFCRDSHRAWLATPGRAGRPHVDNPIRQFQDKPGWFRDRWDLLDEGDVA
jgi:hypothetical protein